VVNGDSIRTLEPLRFQAAAWTRSATANLLRRTGFGPTGPEVDQLHELIGGKGLEAAVDRLLAGADEAADVSARHERLKSAALSTGDIKDLKAWWLAKMLRGANPLVERMTLLWHNHFATSQTKVNSVPKMLAQNELFRRHAVGRFGDLLAGVARDPAMLIWLDGRQNKRRAPNENFARELFELFGLGVGNYTETDIKQAARAFTGWTLRGDEYFFDPHQHDTGPKTVFGKTGAWDGDDILRLTLEHPACAKFLAFKILREFAAHDPPADILADLATTLRESKHDVRAALRRMLLSAWFHGGTSLIRSPVLFVAGALRSLGSADESFPETSVNLRTATDLTARLGQDLFEPPTVKGWDGGRNWIHSATLLQRTRFIGELLSDKGPGRIAPQTELVARAKLDGPAAMVDHYLTLLIATPVSPATRTALEGMIHSSSPAEEDLRALLQAILTLPEAQLG
jgi:uncharacterized protein (DUF1800 family)